MGRSFDDVHFTLAHATHDADIRRLLRESPMEGDVSLTLQREPSYFQACRIEGSEHHTIVAIDRGQIVCVGSVSIRERYYNGRPIRIGYLGQLRLAPSHAGRFDILRRGYQFFRSLHQTLNTGVYLTSIAAGNRRAIRLLGRGLLGFPCYRHVGDLVTVLINVPSMRYSPANLSIGARARIRRAGLTPRHGSPQQRDAIVQRLNDLAPSFQFASRWSRDDLDRACTSFSLRDEDFRLLFDDDRLIACAAMWDQRSFKQTVVTQYARRLSLMRPILNGWASLSGRGVVLPPIGRPAPQAFISFMAAPLDPTDRLEMLIDLLRATARSNGIRMLALGLDERDPRLPRLLRRFRPHVYRTRLYSVCWPDDASDVQKPDGRLMNPDVALL